MATTDELVASVEANASPIPWSYTWPFKQSVVILLTGLVAQLNAAQGEANLAVTQAAIDEIEANIDRLATAATCRSC